MKFQKNFIPSHFHSTLIRKSSTIRLQSNLLRAGYDEQQVKTMNRTQLIAEWANVLANGKAEKGEPAGVGYDPEIERERLQLDREKLALEQKKTRV